MAGLLSVFAEFARDIMRERVRAGRVCRMRASRETPWAVDDGHSQSNRCRQILSARRQQIRDPSAPRYRPDIGPPPTGTTEILSVIALRRLTERIQLS